jgi:acyl-CoA synthetase (NDP forming)
LKKLFNPHSVAIFASMKEGKTGYEIAENMERLKSVNAA